MSATYEINWPFLSEIFYRNYRRQKTNAIAKRLADIEAKIRETGSVTPEQKAFLNQVFDQNDTPNGDGLGGWAYRLLQGG